MLRIFFEIKDINWGNINVKFIACAIANLVRHGWPPIFAIVYDEVSQNIEKLALIILGVVDGLQVHFNATNCCAPSTSV